MKNITLFSIHQSHRVGSTTHVDYLDLEKAFKRLVQNFVDDDGNSFVLFETIVLSCILIESIIRELLCEINPALLLDRPDPTDIALISGKQASLLQPVIKSVSDVRTSNINDLLKRFLMFNDKGIYKDGITSLFRYRNRILHVARDNVINRYELTLLFTKYIFPFIKEYVDVPEKEWEKVEKIRKVAHDYYRADLVRKILKYRQNATLISQSTRLGLSNETPTLLDQECLYKDHLTCPACSMKAVYAFSGVDFDYSPEGFGDVHGYNGARCRVCELEFDQEAINEIVDNPKEYFENENQGVDWEDLPDEFDTSTLDY